MSWLIGTICWTDPPFRAAESVMVLFAAICVALVAIKACSVVAVTGFPGY